MKSSNTGRMSNFHLEDFPCWAYFSQKRSMETALPETKKMPKGIFRWLGAGSLPRKWPGLLRFSLRDNRAWFCFIMSACFINCEMKKIANNANHNQCTCPSEAPLMHRHTTRLLNLHLRKGMGQHHFWSPNRSMTNLRCPSTRPPAIAHITKCWACRPLCSCKSVGSTPTTNPLGVQLPPLGGIWLGVMAAWGDCLKRLYFYVLLDFFGESSLTWLIHVWKYHLHSDWPSSHIQKPVM